MPCFGVLFALLAPRFVILILFLVTSWFKGMFDTALWPVLGFLFLPSTLLWYSAVQNWWHGEWGTVQIIGLVIAIVLDTSPASAGRRQVRAKR